MSDVSPKKFSLIPPTLVKFFTANFTPKTIQYFSILLLLRTLLGKVKIRRKMEDLAYILVLEPVVLTLMHVGGRSKWPFSTKYRIFLDRAVWPTGVSPRYEKLHDCTQFHPGTDKCASAMLAEAPVTLNKLITLYMRFYLIQFAVTYLIQSVSFFLSESKNHWAHYIRNIRKRREKEAELERIRYLERLAREEAEKKGTVVGAEEEPESEEEEEDEDEEEEEEVKPKRGGLRKIDSAVDIAALGTFTSMTGIRSTHRGRERFIRPQSPAVDSPVVKATTSLAGTVPSITTTELAPGAKAADGEPKVAEQDNLLAPQPRRASRSVSGGRHRRRSSVAPPPTVPINLNTLKNFIVSVCFDHLPNQLFRYTEAVVRSTAFLWSNEMVIRAGYCTLAEIDRRRTGNKIADISKYWPIIYLINVVGSIPMVLERHSRVAIINRMMVGYIMGDLLPSTKEAAYASMIIAFVAGIYSRTLGFQTLFGAAWSAIEM